VKAARSVLVVLLMCVSAFAQNRATDYVVSLLNYTGSTITRATGINNRGVIIGSHRIPPQRPFFYRDGQFTDVPLPLEGFAQGMGLNDRGDSIGIYHPDDSGLQQGWLLTADGNLTLLAVSGATFTNPRAINNAGTVVGYFGAQDGSVHCFIYRDGQYRQYDVPGAADTVCGGINSEGTVSGNWDTDPNTLGHGFIAKHSGAGDASVWTFDHPRAIANGTTLAGINDRGDVAGGYIGADGSNHAFVRFASGLLVNVDVAGADFTNAFSVNNYGTVVGNTILPGDVRQAFVATPEP
jgi:probable HAF family extracellular repeat protein